MTYEEKKTWLKRQQREHRQPRVGKVEAYWTDISSALNELEKAWAALEFYADSKNYELIELSDFFVEHDTSVEGDNGKRARGALNE